MNDFSDNSHHNLFKVYDLLDPCSTQNCTVRESNEKGVYVEGLMEQTVNSAAEAYQVK